MAIYGTGREAEKFLDEIGRPKQIKGFLTKDLVEKFLDYPILSIENWMK